VSEINDLKIVTVIFQSYSSFFFRLFIFISCGSQPWMKELKGMIHRGEGAFLRCPVFTSVQFSLRDEGSTEYNCVRGKITGDNIYRCQSACPIVLNDVDLFKENITSQSL
jgi:hypothetical protein